MTVDSNIAFLIKSNMLGEGEPDLGEKLITSMFQMLTESGRLPQKIMFINSGIFLTTEGTPLLEQLRKLEENGVTILSCGTCLDYYSRSDKLLVGKPTDMRATVESLVNCRVISL